MRTVTRKAALVRRGRFNPDRCQKKAAHRFTQWAQWFPQGAFSAVHGAGNAAQEPEKWPDIRRQQTRRTPETASSAPRKNRKEVIPLNETAAHPAARIRADRTTLTGRFDMPLDGHRTGRYQTRRNG